MDMDSISCLFGNRMYVHLRAKEFCGTQMLKSETIGTLVRQIRVINLNKTLEIITINKNHSCFKILRDTRIDKKHINSTLERKAA
jgi:hypothetical protein